MTAGKALPRMSEMPRRHGASTARVPALILLLTLACTSGARPSTPEPFPEPGVRQLTFDSAYYRDPIWSPDGQWIAATRCDLYDGKPACELIHGDAVLIESTTGTTRDIGFPVDTPLLFTAHPERWSPDGRELLAWLLIRDSTDSAIRAPVSEYWLYEPASGLARETRIPVEPVIAWNKARDSLLIIHLVKEGEYFIGWYDLEDGTFAEELALDEDEYLAFASYALSPDERTLLRSDSVFPGNCRDVESYLLGSEDGFRPFLSNACFPAWSPDGTKIAYIGNLSPDEPPAMVIIANADGSNAQPLFSEESTLGLTSFPAWSPDGTKIAFAYGNPENAIFVADVPEELMRK